MLGNNLMLENTMPSLSFKPSSSFRRYFKVERANFDIGKTTTGERGIFIRYVYSMLASNFSLAHIISRFDRFYIEYSYEA